MGAVAFSVAGNSVGGAGHGDNGVLPQSFRALPGGGSEFVAMLAAPVATFFYYRNADSVPISVAATPASVFMKAAQWRPAVAAASEIPRQTGVDLFPIMVQLWLAGVAIFSLRSAGGFFLLERLRRRRSVPVDSKLQQICRDPAEQARPRPCRPLRAMRLAGRARGHRMVPSRRISSTNCADRSV